MSHWDVVIAEPMDKKIGMTVDELGAWLQEVYRRGIPGDTKVDVTCGFRSQITRLEAKG